MKELIAFFLLSWAVAFLIMPMSLDCITDIISWNVWQMDGLKKTVPGTDIPCKIKDWEAYKEILFKDVGENEQ